MREEHLAEGEEVIMEMRTHRKVLIIPLIWLGLFAALAIVVWLLVPALDLPSWSPLVGIGIVVVLALASVFPAYLKWLTTEYIITNQRVATRLGVITHTGRDIPLYRVNDVTFEKHLNDRFFGCGTLVVSDGSDREGMALDDVPDVEAVHRTLQELVRKSDPRNV